MKVKLTDLEFEIPGYIPIEDVKKEADIISGKIIEKLIYYLEQRLKDIENNYMRKGMEDVQMYVAAIKDVRYFLINIDKVGV